ncbi:MAG TPA: serine/threonine-protein kinase [Gemmatimonadales bacterium]
MPGTALLDRIRAALAAQYTVLDEIAAGGQGHVFRAHDRRLRRDVAIKVLRPELATAGAAARFVREAQVLARLKHPNILAVHDAGEVDGLSFYVMDFADGETLASRLARGPLPEPELMALARDLLAALEAAHRAGVVHRDVKPSNIFFQDSRALLGDFGVAHVHPAITTDASVEGTEPGRLIGTTGYMSPEQLLGTATSRSDIYSAACVLFEAATGSPWKGLGDSADWSRVPPRLAGPLRRALELDPRARWRDAAEFTRALARAPRSRPAAIPVAVVVAAAGLGGFVWFARAPAGSAPGAMPTADLAVVPFQSSDAVGHDLASFVASALEWSPRWAFRPYREVLPWWDSAGSQAEALAPSRLRALNWADGRIRVTPGDDTLDLRIHGLNGSGTLKVPGSSEDLVRWAYAVADSIVRRTFPEWSNEFRELMAGSSRDYEANRLLIAGMDAFARDRWDEAGAFLEAALARDPGLDRAAFELDLLYRWRREPLDANLARLVQRAGERIAEPYGALLRTEQELDLQRRVDVLEAIVREYSYNERARFLLLNELFHRGPLIGIPLEETLQRLESGMRSSPYLDQVAMYDHLAWGYIHLGRAEEAKTALERRAALVASSGGGDPFGSLLDLAWKARFAPFLARAKAWMAIRLYGDDPGMLAQMLRFALTFDVPALQRQLAAGLAGGRDPGLRTTAQMAEGLALLELGRAREGLARIDSASSRLSDAAAPVQALAWRVVPATLGIPFSDSSAHHAARVELRRRVSAGSPGAREAAWILAIDDAAAGVAVDTAQWERGGLADSSAGATYLATILAGIDLARRGLFDSALAVTSPAIIDDSSGAVGSAFARAVLHVHRGNWHLALGRPVEADRSWLFHENSHLRGYPDGVIQAGEVDAVLSVYVRLLRAELARTQGNTERACSLARRVHELWADADERFAPFLARARGVLDQCP